MRSLRRSPTASGSWWRAAATTTRARARRRRRSPSRWRACGSPARATSSPSSRSCAAALGAEGLFAPQKALARPALPRCLGVVTGEHGKARDDVLAALRRRGWAGRLVWAFAPVQDRHAAPAVTRALQDLAACPEVEVVIVARGGGSLADLFAFCDETLCRTVALLRVPVIASVGHHTDRTLIDDVAAVSVLDPDARRRGGGADRLPRRPRRPARARRASGSTGAPRDRPARAHAHHALARPRPARGATPGAAAPAGARAAGEHRARARRRAGAASATMRGGWSAGPARSSRPPRAGRPAWTPTRRRSTAPRAAARARRATELERLRIALDAHDPQRTLERGYALVEDAAGAPVTSAEAARAERELTLRLADGALPVRPDPPPTRASPPAGP